MDDVSTDGDFFSTQLRYAIAMFLFAVFAYALALAYQQFDATGIWGSPPQTPVAAAPTTLHSLPFHLCAVVLALAGLWLLLLISAAACTTPDLHLHYLLFWVERDFVSVSWTGMSWASTVAVLVVFPFAYLYEEAEGITSQSGVMSRIIETTIVQVLLSVLFHGSLALFQFLLTGQRLGLSFFTSGVAFQLPGLLLFLVYFRDGFQRMVVGAVALFEAWSDRDPEHIAAYEFALESVLLQIESLTAAATGRRRPRYPLGSSEALTLEVLQQQLHDLQVQHGDAVRRRSRCQTLGRNLVAAALLVLSVILPGGIALRSLLKCEDLVLDLVRRLFGVRLRLNMVRTLVESVALHPLLSLGVDVALVLYLLAAVASAAFDSPSFRWIAGLQGHTRSPIQFMLARNTFILLLCANLPVVTSLLGITRIDIEKVFPDPQGYPSLIYCSTFLIIQTVSALELFGIPSRRPMTWLVRLICYCCCCPWKCRRRQRRLRSTEKLAPH